MNKKRIAVTWEMCGYIDVEANSVEEAMGKFMQNSDNYSLPIQQEYVDGSFRLSTDDSSEMMALCYDFYHPVVVCGSMKTQFKGGGCFDNDRSNYESSNQYRCGSNTK